MSDGDNRNGCPSFDRLVNHDIASDHDTPQAWIDALSPGVSGREAGTSLLMRNDAAGFNIRQASVNIPKEIKFFEERLEAVHVDENRRPLPFLGEYDRALRFLCLSRSSALARRSAAGCMSSAISNKIRGIRTSVPSYGNASGQAWFRLTVASISP
jgi:hypothetical protein